MIWVSKDFKVWYLVGKDWESDAKEYDGIKQQIDSLEGR